MNDKKRYVHVGTGQRSWMYLTALAGKHADSGLLCALCDTNSHRMDYWNRYLGEKYNCGPVPTYRASTGPTTSTSAGPWSWDATSSPRNP